MSEGLKPCPFCDSNATELSIMVDKEHEPHYVYVFCRICGARGSYGGSEAEAIMMWNRCCRTTKSDNIHPDHYKLSGTLQVIDFIEALGLGKGFELGNAIKYIARVGKKNGEDGATTIDKAIWYLNRFKDKYVKETKEDKK